MGVAVDDVLILPTAVSPSLQSCSARPAECGKADKRVAVVIVNWNGWKDTIECLDTLLALDYSDFIAVVVDNDSHDGSVDRISEWCANPYRMLGSSDIEGVRRISDCARPRSISFQTGVAGARLSMDGGCKVLIIRSGGNLGFAGGCNVGAEYAIQAECDYVWLLNSDTVVHRYSLAELVVKASESSVQGFTGSTLIYYRRPTIVQALGGADLSMSNCVIRHRGEGKEHVQAAPDDLAELALTYIVGASMLVPASLCETIGLMQDDYFLYYEEIDWAYRSRGRYWQTHASRSLVYHKAGASSKDKVSEFSKRLLSSNKLLFFSRYIPHLNFQVRFEMLKELLRDIVKRRWRFAKILLCILSNSDSGSKQGILITE